MVIEKIILNNFRAYAGVNEISLSTDPTKNISIVSGDNGYGKTSFLTSLVWCLYGKLMSEVDERYKREIYEAGGYRKYCEGILSRSTDEKAFSVTIRLSNTFIPYIPCNSVQIKRAFYFTSGEETIEILIDEKANELTKNVGTEIFINDFILPKEIAKFFFFDSEKIVELAEVKDAEEKRDLSYAYAEVLGIKKYVDLKQNLENLRLRLRKKTYNKEDTQRLNKLRKQEESNDALIIHHDQMIREKEAEILIKRAASDKLQEQLLRQGTSLTIEDMQDFKAMKEHLSGEIQHLKEKFKGLQDLAPFAIASRKMVLLKEKLDSELNLGNKRILDSFVKRKLENFEKTLRKRKKDLSLNSASEKSILELTRKIFLPSKETELEYELNFSAQELEKFTTLYKNLQNSYSQEFKHLVSELKRQQSAFNMIVRKVTDAEAKENDPVIKRIRKDKVKLDTEISALESQVLDAKVEKTTLLNETRNIKKQISELSKNLGVEEIDRAKDETSERLIKELDDFIHRLKVKKKASLEKNILDQLKKLMHKADFINRVEVLIDGDMIDLELFDKHDQVISKDRLSKGEQQLYATAILKGLIDESNIRFPVFIDSPLQKFDKIHARNIITDFYPNVSTQVVLFPLMGTEISMKEFKLLQGKIGKFYLLRQKNSFSTFLQEVSIKDMVEKHMNLYA